MKKRPFVLLELLIAIAILVIAFIPLVGTPFFAFKKRRIKLLEIELQREVELLFYQTLREFRHTHPKWGFNGSKNGAYKKKEGRGEISLDLGGFGKSSHPYHFHLYELSRKDGLLCYRLWYKVCFETPRATCSVQRSQLGKTNNFSFLVKKEVKDLSFPHDVTDG